jgi:iron-sulfur cluster repair protein YtfE (RIC family)
MPYTDNFRRQHQEILSVVGEIQARLQPEQVRTDPKSVRTLLSSLAGKLSIHLAMEDKALYPRMIQADVENSKAMATAFKSEMGSIGQVFAAYNQKWQPAQMTADPAGFVRETQDLFGALGKRIERENGQLYPLADRALGA